MGSNPSVPHDVLSESLTTRGQNSYTSHYFLLCISQRRLMK